MWTRKETESGITGSRRSKQKRQIRKEEKGKDKKVRWRTRERMYIDHMGGGRGGSGYQC